MKNSKTTIKKLVLMTFATIVAVPTVLVSSSVTTNSSTKAALVATTRNAKQYPKNTKNLTAVDKREQRKDLYYEKRECHRKTRHLNHLKHHHTRRLNHLNRTGQGKSPIAANHRSMLKDIESSIHELDLRINTIEAKIQALI